MMKKLILLGTTIILTGCGFTPMHAPENGLTASAMRDIDVEVIEPQKVADQEGAFWLQQSLHDRLGENPGGAHILELIPRFGRGRLSLSADGVSLRYDLRVIINYRLIDRKTGDVLEKSSISSVSTFGAPRDPYGEESARKNTLRNVTRDAADKLIVKLASYYAKAQP